MLKILEFSSNSGEQAVDSMSLNLSPEPSSYHFERYYHSPSPYSHHWEYCLNRLAVVPERATQSIKPLAPPARFQDEVTSIENSRWRPKDDLRHERMRSGLGSRAEIQDIPHMQMLEDGAQTCHEQDNGKTRRSLLAFCSSHMY